MAEGPGQEFGQEIDWATYVDHFRRSLGGWSKLADALIERAWGVVDAPDELGSVEKGLRRLAARGQKPGGDYGRWMLRFFGMPPDAERWLRWIAQYHTRFADLPTSLRLQQLRLWDRPPVSESRLSTWVDLGMASVHMRMEDAEAMAARLDRALARAEQAGPLAQMEAELFEAYHLTNAQKRHAAEALFDRVEARLESIQLREERLPYQARLIGQRAYHLTKPAPGEVRDERGALRLFRSIEDAPDIPFVAYRRAAGLAWCTWRLGDAVEGARLARMAAQHAGDGGLVRFRVMALNMLARMVPEQEAQQVRTRALRLARQLEDENLLQRAINKQLKER